MIEVVTRRMLHHIYAIILALSSHPQERIDAFCQAYLASLKNDPSSPEKLIMISDFEAVINPFYLGITVKHADISGRKTSITVIADNEEMIKNELADITTKINTITHSNANVIVEFGLNKLSAFYTGKDADIRRRFAELKYKIGNDPAYSTVLPLITTLVTKIEALYGDKFDKKDDVSDDITALLPLVDPITKALIIGFCKLNIEHIDNLGAVARYFHVDLMDLDVNDPNFLGVGQWLVDLSGIEMKNDPRVIFKFIDKLKVQSYSLFDAMVFLSDDPNPTVIPGRAVLVKAGETVEFPINSIGSTTELYLIFASTTTGENVKFKVTVIKG